MDLVSRLKLYLNHRGISVTQFADECDIPRPTASQLLAGRNKKVSDEMIGKIHYTYPGLSISWLMFGEGEMLTNSDNKVIPTINQSEKNIQSSGGFRNNLNPIMDIDQSATSHAADYSNSTVASNVHFPQTSENENPVQSPSAPSVENGYTNTPPSGQQSFQSHKAQPLSQSYGSPATTYTQPSTPQSQNNMTGQHGPNGEKEKSKSTFVFSDTESSDKDALRTIRLTPDVRKSVVGIVVYYNDNTYESFIPDPDGKHPFIR